MSFSADNKAGYPMHIYRYQSICRTITADTESFLEMYPQVEELFTPSLRTSRDFFHATFVGQQFNLILPYRVKYIYPNQERDKRKSMMVLSYSEKDSHMHLQEIVPPK